MSVVPEKNVLTVSAVNRRIKELMANDEILRALWVRGEISNFKLHSSGHMYFTLKDENAVVKCVMFKGASSGMKFKPADGMRVTIKGQVSVYEKDGQYQVYAEYMEPDGVGSLHIAFEQLKVELQQAGYFDARYKKKIPYMPDRICVLTSPTGAVIRDILNVLSRRHPGFNVCIYPVAVQGTSAAPQIARAIRNINEKSLANVIIIARGGGSLEELWAFNEREVATAIFNSEIPVISAVGHETDYTIADFVADLRAPTPSAAAEIVLPEKVLLKSTVVSMESRLGSAFYSFVKVKREFLRQIIQRPVFRQPLAVLNSHRMSLDSLGKFLPTYMQKTLQNKKSLFAKFSGKLEALNPLSILLRGFGVVRNIDDGKVLTTIEKIRESDRIEVELIDGKFDCLVQKVYREGGKRT